WTASTLMPSDQQKTVLTGTIYDPSKSPTSQVVKGSGFNVSYMDGSGASGPVVKDTVSIGGGAVPNMPLGVCSDLRYGNYSNGTRDTNGPVGLGFRALNTVRPIPQCTFMECLQPYLPEPIFCTSFKLDNSGAIEFGYVSELDYTGDLTTVPITNTTSGHIGHWAYKGVRFGSGGKVLSSASSTMLFDTGTPFLRLPPDAASRYFALIPGSSYSSSWSSWEYPCGKTLPDFDYIFPQVSSGPNKVTIPGIRLQQGRTPSGLCVTWIRTTENLFNAGTPFYTSKYMIWNQSAPSLAFANQVT
ncbi:MAG: hypothetical protein Q9217_006885, partial [Psora testacea]